MAPLIIPPIKTPIAHPRKQPIVLPPQLDLSCVLCLLPLRDTKWRDFSGKGNHGTISGATWTAKGRLGPTLYFDGLDDYVDITPTVTLPVDDSGRFRSGSVGVWVKAADITSTSGFIYLSDSIGDGSVSVFFQKATNKIKVYTQDLQVYWYTSSVILANTWYFLVLTHNGTHYRVYLDGVCVKTQAHGATASHYSHFFIGAGYNKYFKGTIDEVHIYNRALTAAEIKALYELGAEVRS